MNSNKNYHHYYQQYYCPYIQQNFYMPPYLRQEDILTVPESAKTKKVFHLGNDFFIPEFKIAKCNTSRAINYLLYSRAFKISMNRVKQEFKNAESSVKAATKRLNDEINKLIGNNNAEIKKLEEEILKLKQYLFGLDCPLDAFETSSLCLTPAAQQAIRELKDREEKLRELKSKKSFWDSFDSARSKFQNSLQELARNEIPNVKWPERWPTLEDIEFMPVVMREHLDLPKTLKDMNIDSSLIKEIPTPQNIETMLNLPPDLKFNVDLDALKSQIQFDDLSYSAEQVLTDLKNKAMSELEKYNMCLFIKNTPYSIQIQLEYISSFKKLVEEYIMGCLEKARNAAIMVFLGYVPSIINTYGATIPAAISNAFATYWSTLKKCLFDIYNAYKQIVENATNATGFDEFLKAIEKIVSIDFVMEKRSVPWENKGSLIDLVSKARGKILYEPIYLSNRYMNVNARYIYESTRQVPFAIPPEEEYVQSEPQFSYVGTDHTMDEESLIKTIYDCGRLGMWIFVTLKEIGPYGKPLFLWLNVKGFANNILSGYTVDRNAEGKKEARYLDIPIQNIKNLICLDLSIYTRDLKEDLFIKHYIIDFCSTNRGEFFGKGYLDMNKGVLIYYEVYECGVYTRIYVDDVSKSELYIPRFGEKITHVYKHPVTATTSYTIFLEITKREEELQNRLLIQVSENLLEETTSSSSWKIKLPW